MKNKLCKYLGVSVVLFLFWAYGFVNSRPMLVDIGSGHYIDVHSKHSTYLSGVDNYNEHYFFDSVKYEIVPFQIDCKRLVTRIDPYGIYRTKEGKESAPTWTNRTWSVISKESNEFKLLCAD